MNETQENYSTKFVVLKENEFDDLITDTIGHSPYVLGFCAGHINDAELITATLGIATIALKKALFGESEVHENDTEID